MAFEILPVIPSQLSGGIFEELPVELMAAVLRYLDPESLLNSVRAYKVCKNVCFGDPIVRRRLKAWLAEKNKLEMERTLDPALGVAVTRSETEKIFGKNVGKEVAVHIFPKNETLEDVKTSFANCKRKLRRGLKSAMGKRGNYRL